MKIKTTTEIKTERLCLKSIESIDATMMIDILKNGEIAKTYMLPDFKSDDEAMRLFDRLKSLSESNEHFVRGIYLDGKIIGFMNDVEIKDGVIELGYVIHPNYKSRGFATEALGAAAKALLSSGLSAVRTGAFSENAASLRVMEKCGMTKIDYTENIEYRGKTHLCIFYELRG